MPPQAPFQFRAIPLHPTPHRRVIGFQATFLRELFDIAQRQRVSKIPTDCTKNECGSVCRYLKTVGRIAMGPFSLPARGSADLHTAKKILYLTTVIQVPFELITEWNETVPYCLAFSVHSM